MILLPSRTLTSLGTQPGWITKTEPSRAGTNPRTFQIAFRSPLMTISRLINMNVR